MTAILTKYSFFKENNSIFEEELPKKGVKSINSPNILPNKFLTADFNFKSPLFSNRFINIGYLKSLISSGNVGQIQPVIKIISGAKHIKGVKAAVNYIARFAGLKQTNDGDEKIQLYNQDGKIIETKEEAGRIIKEWQKDFKTGQNMMTHMLFSPGGKEEKNKKKAFLATKKFLEDNLKARGFDYFFAAHHDTDNHHFHVIIKKKNKLKENLRFDKHDFFVLRDQYAKQLTSYGIKSNSVARMDKKEVLENIEKKITALKEQNSHYQSKLSNKSTKDFNAYVYKANIAGRIESIIKEISFKEKEVGFFDQSKLKQNLKELKDFKKEIVKSTNKEEVKRAIELTIQHFNKENQAISKKIDDLINKDENVKFAYLKRKEQGKYLKQIIQKQVDEIKKAEVQLKEDLKVEKFDPEDQNIIKDAFVHFGLMKDMAKRLDKGLGIGIKVS